MALDLSALHVLPLHVLPLHVVLAPLSTRTPRARRFEASRAVVAEALRASGELAGAPRALPYDDWPRSASGAPAACGGWHASFADTTGLVLALLAPAPVAVDAEWRLRPRWHAARERFRAAGELALLGGDSRDEVLALWTAKEALLKLAGAGLADLARCALLRRGPQERDGARRYSLCYSLPRGGAEHAVWVRRAGAHWLACASAVPAEPRLHTLQEVA